jgi:hypothetical protein
MFDEGEKKVMGINGKMDLERKRGEVVCVWVSD